MKKVISVITVLAIVAMIVFAGFAITESPRWSFVGLAWSMIATFFGIQVVNDCEQDEEVEEDEVYTIVIKRV